MNGKDGYGVCNTIPDKLPGEPYFKAIPDMNNYYCMPPETWAAVQNRQADLEEKQCSP